MGMSPSDKKIFLEKMKTKPTEESSTINVDSEVTPPKPIQTVTIKKNGVEASIPQQAKNFVKSMGSWAKSGFKLASKEEYDNRMIICRKCEFWTEIPGPIIGRCKKCGCTGAKQKLATSRCPINLWGKTSSVK